MPVNFPFLSNVSRWMEEKDIRDFFSFLMHFQRYTTQGLRPYKIQ